MAAQTGTAARPTHAWHRPCPHSRRDPRRRQIGPVVEALELRLVLAGISPTNPSPIGPKPDVFPSPLALGAAYQQVVRIQTKTLQSLGEIDREVQAASAQFARRTAAAINNLNAELRQSKSLHEANAIAAAIRRDRNLLALGGTDIAREEQGLDVARSIANQQANSDKIDIPNGLIPTTLDALVQQDQATGTAISRSGQRSKNALLHELNKLGDQLISTIRVRSSARNQPA
jgi:hypothetical protein